MNKETYLTARQAAEKEYNELADKQESLVRELSGVERRMGQLRETIVSLSRLCGDTKPIEGSPAALAEAMRGVGDAYREYFNDAFGGGLTDAVRQVLKGYSEVYQFATDVRDSLIRSGYDVTKQTNVLASIHTTLKRLVESGEAEWKEIDDRSAYRYQRKTLLKGKTLTKKTLRKHGV